MRRAMGVAVFAGMIGVTFFGLMLTPVFFVVISNVVERFFPRRQPDAKNSASVAHTDHPAPATGV
jgi:hypothetical protein